MNKDEFYISFENKFRGTREQIIALKIMATSKFWISVVVDENGFKS